MKKLRIFENYENSWARNLVAQRVVSLPQKCAKTRLHASAISKNFPGLYPRTPVKMGKGWDGTGFGEGEGKERRGREGEGRKGKGKLRA
jgi:hypothetical protein